MSPPPGVALSGAGGGSSAALLATEWWQWLDGTRSSPPESVRHWWHVIEDAGEVEIEALAAGGEWNVIEALLAHCGLPWDDACLEFHRTSATLRTPSAWQVREPLHARSSGRWRHYERHLGPLKAALAA